jgi:anti-anti-sigma factor
MNAIFFEPHEALVVAPADITELVRGEEHRLLEWVAPLLRESDVALDLEKVERIDAAGVAALISLYSTALEAGHKFAVCNLSERVSEILDLVGLSPIFLSHNAVNGSQCEPCYERSAA